MALAKPVTVGITTQSVLCLMRRPRPCFILLSVLSIVLKTLPRVKGECLWAWPKKECSRQPSETNHAACSFRV